MAAAPDPSPPAPAPARDFFMCADCGSIVQERDGKGLYTTQAPDGSVYCPGFKRKVPTYSDMRVSTQCLVCELALGQKPEARPRTGRYANRVHCSRVRPPAIPPPSAKEVMSDPTVLLQEAECAFVDCPSRRAATNKPNLVAVDSLGGADSLARRFTCFACTSQWQSETAVLLPARPKGAAQDAPVVAPACPFAECPTRPKYADGVRIKDERSERAGLHVRVDRRAADDGKPRYTCSECSYQWGDGQWVLKCAPTPAPLRDEDEDTDVGEQELFGAPEDEDDSMDDGAGVGL